MASPPCSSSSRSPITPPTPQRFYDPDAGYIELDGKNIKVDDWLVISPCSTQGLNVGWMRERIGVVGQEPVLFDLSIMENIRVGRMEVGCCQQAVDLLFR